MTNNNNPWPANTPAQNQPAPGQPMPNAPVPVAPAPTAPASGWHAPNGPVPVAPAPTAAPATGWHAPNAPAPVTPAPVTPAPVAPAPQAAPGSGWYAPNAPAPVTPDPVAPAPQAAPATGQPTPVAPQSPQHEMQTPYIPPFLQRNGLLTMRIREFQSHCSDRQIKQLDNLSSDLDQLRNHGLRNSSLRPPRDQFIAFLRNVMRIDPVLGYVIATQEGCDDIANTFIDRAFDKFVEFPSLYRHIFGDLLPEDFRREVDQAAYHAGSNFTALDDWQTFVPTLIDERVESAGDGLNGLPSGLPELDADLGGLSGLVIFGGDKGVG